jgi:hypothetical protein
MSFYLRKSIKLGLLRFNLSKSGVGASLGVKGIRFGINTKGNYIHLGRSGFYYKKTLPVQQQISQDNPGESQFLYNEIPKYFEKIQSESTLLMKDADSKDFLDELNEKNNQFEYHFMIAFIGILLVFIFRSQLTFWLTLVLTLVARHYNITRKSIVLFYDFEDDFKSLYEKFINSFKELKEASKIWYVKGTSKIELDKKYTAGVEIECARDMAKLYIEEPKFIKTNLEVPILELNNRFFYFLPDQIIVKDNDGYGAIQYSDIETNSYTGKFVEYESLPRDVEIVGYTWQYVNKNGGPDLRFKDNVELPIVEYQYLNLYGKGLINEVLCISKLNSQLAFEESIFALGLQTTNSSLNKNITD